jgi:hypothetical protein
VTEIDASEEAIQTGRELLGMSGADIASRLHKQAYERCPFHGRHYLTMDEVIDLIPEGQGKTPPLIRARFAKNGITGLRSSFDADTVIDYLNRAPGKGWARGQKRERG